MLLLNGYKKLTDRIEKYKALYGDAGYATAIEECIKENMEISEYLQRKTQEVSVSFCLSAKLSLWEFA